MPPTPLLRLHVCALLLLLLCSSSVSCFRNNWEYCRSVNKCGDFNISYPFGKRHSGCGDQDFQLDCDAIDGHPLLTINEDQYRILKPYNLANTTINHSITMAINFQWDKCKEKYTQSRQNSSNYFRMVDEYTQLNFWGDCDQSNSFVKNYTQNMSLCGSVWYYIFNGEIDLISPLNLVCKTQLQLPIKKEVLQLNKSINNQTFLRDGFEILWSVDPYRDQNCVACLTSNGICGSNESTTFLCYCPDGTSGPDKCYGDGNKSANIIEDSSTKTLPVILGIVGGVVITSLVCLFALWSKLKSAISQRTVTPAQKEATLLKHEQQTLFTLGEIIEATDNFNGKNKLGEGGFGPVYRGKTRDGNEIAVKKLSAKSAQGKREFMNEVELVANVQHRNLVKLIGCCAEESERLLVYEYLPNKSLDTIVFDAKKKSQLDWQRRYNIIMGIARGLLYLHEDSRLRIIHRDIKASNILLDQELNPKIADFGLARLFPENVTHVQTKIAGTYGYMAPEYAMHGRLSMKVDVYSFGVLIIEIVSGRKSSDTNLPQQMETLLDWAWTLYKQGNLVNMIDSTLSETCREEEALRCIHVALLCTQTDASIRPTMPNVIGMLTNSIIELPIPITTSKSIFSTTS